VHKAWAREHVWGVEDVGRVECAAYTPFRGLADIVTLAVLEAAGDCKGQAGTDDERKLVLYSAMLKDFVKWTYIMCLE